MTVSQARFREAVLDPAAAVPPGLQDGQRAPAGNRFSVYRNNVIVSLTEALQTAFPLVAKLVGGDRFSRLAAVYVREHPPKSPLMMHYGVDFPAFLEGFAPLQHIGYLPDCARLDLLIRQSYHAADAPPVPAERLQCAPEDLVTLRLSLAPAVRILRSPWPVHDIWRMNTQEGAPKPRPVAQDVMIARPGFDPAPWLLPPGGACWLDCLGRGLTLGEAHEAALAETADFDLAAVLTLALQSGALTDPTTKDG
ncbi:DNA-binding domain-containing protein [uncultured Roseobacter sp.]|uniref:HvfC/BufC N-terminal domain-containing protein n=1 Tax=uncultured Roseobacter sp. TaxID=114847 RepID=UPI0026386E68|nr:DNA-binding domain-containing protein [uncultured Roseobacter sp.]